MATKQQNNKKMKATDKNSKRNIVATVCLVIILQTNYTMCWAACGEKPASTYESKCPSCIKQVCEIFDPIANAWVEFNALCIPAGSTDRCYESGEPINFRYTEYGKGSSSNCNGSTGTCVYVQTKVETRTEKEKFHGVCLP